MRQLSRITTDPAVMGGKSCIRGQRVTVSMLIGLIASGKTTPQILSLYPYLEAEDITQALRYATWLVKETELPLAPVQHS